MNHNGLQSSDLLFFIWIVHENIKKYHQNSKVGYFSKIEEIFITALAKCCKSMLKLDSPFLRFLDLCYKKI